MYPVAHQFFGQRQDCVLPNIRCDRTDLFEANDAIAIDPDYALPYLGLADFYIWSAIFGEIPSKEGFAKAKTAIRRALDIDDNLGEAYAGLAFTVLCEDWNWSWPELKN